MYGFWGAPEEKPNVQSCEDGESQEVNKLTGEKTLTTSLISQLLLIDSNGDKSRLKCFSNLPLEKKCVSSRVLEMSQTVTNSFILISHWISVSFYCAIYVYKCICLFYLFIYLFFNLKTLLEVKNSEIVILVLFIATIIYCFELAFSYFILTLVIVFCCNFVMSCSCVF